ncbi:MAG TPA: glycosyltransferase [Terriglobia bacterium]|nr:glycosyltransferase [Terriglobia bacterium]
MKILVLSPLVPWPLHGGNLVRIYGILQELSRHGHEIVLLAGNEGPPLLADHPVRILCRDVQLYPRSSSAKREQPIVAALTSALSPQPYTVAKFGGRVVRENIRRILEEGQFDMILANFAFMAYAVPREYAQRTPIVLDEHESEGLLWRQYLRQGGIPKRAFALLNLFKMRRFQKTLGQRIAAMLCASDRESKFARTFLPPHVKLWTVPNGVDTDYFVPYAPEGRESHSIVLCGGFGVYRNSEAAVWFARTVFPQVKKEVPHVEFWIVGSNPTQEVRQLGELPGIHVTGTVDDVRPFYARAAVTVAPYRYGEGTKLKVLEAMASGAPVVTTPIGCQGIKVIDGEHVLIANSADEFAQRIVFLLRNEELRKGLAARARSVIEREYSWKKIVDDLDPKLCEIARAGAMV